MSGELPPGINWDVLEKASVAIATIGGILTVLLAPFADKLFVWMFKRSRAEVQTCLDAWYAPLHTEHDELVGEHRSLELRFEDHVKHQSERDTELLERFDRGLTQQAETLQAIHNEAQATAKSVSHIYGLLQASPWDGKTERRQSDRRGGE